VGVAASGDELFHEELILSDEHGFERLVVVADEVEGDFVDLGSNLCPVD